ncbi:MAG: T9SS type A sorting domain-containing protein [Bacteroidales bacterium]|nr:T9SS type A sorting domain-containing protein [Bacteroidales bacterium]
MKKSLLFLTIIAFVFEANCQITTVLPKNNAYVPFDDVVLLWNTASDADNYDLEISLAADFTTIYLSKTGIINNTDTLKFDFGYKYYWRVRYFDGTSHSSWSVSNCFTVYRPNDISNNIVYILNADSIHHSSSAIDTVYNTVGSSYFATQNTATAKPTLVPNIINGYPIMRFDGNDFLNGSGSVGGFTQYSFFVVTKATEFANFRWIYQNAPFGTNSSFSVTAITGSKFRFWPQGGSGTGIKDYNTVGTTSNFYALSVINDNNLSTAKAELFFNGLSDGTTNSNTLTHSDIGYKIGVYNSGTNFFKGDIAEVILYDTCLNSSDKFLVDNFLRYKYFPSTYVEPVDLGLDISISDSFCDTLLVAYKDYFASYNWSTGETDSIISVDKSGTYSVTATDIYGIQSIDTVLVSFPFVNQINDTLLCSGASLLWDTGLSIPFTFEWLNSSETGSSLEMYSAGEFAVTVSDIYGCSYHSDTATISFDPINILDSLGIDRAVCSGEPIFLTGYNGEISSYLWNNSDTEEQINVIASGIYSLTVTSPNMCISVDTVVITIKGTAPDIDFTADTVCYGGPTSFFDLTSIIAPDDFSSWSWDFGSSNYSNEQNPEFTFDSFGEFDISLTVVSDSGCFNTITKQVLVKENPVADFVILNGNIQCINQNVEFNDLSQFVTAALSYEWLVDDELFSNSANPIVNFDIAGNYDISLVATDNNGCTDTSTSILTINSSLPLPIDFFTVSPSDNYQFYDTNQIELSWNNSENYIYYVLEVFDHDSPETPLFEINTNSNSETILIADTSHYFWLVKAYNLCGNYIISNLSNFSINSLDTSNIGLWFDASFDLSITNDSLINQWTDRKNSNIVQQSMLSLAPVLDTVSEINNQKSAKFDGINDNFIYDFQTEVGSLLAVCNYNSSSLTFPDYKGIINSPTVVSKSYILLADKSTDLMYTGGGNLLGSNINVNNASNMVMSPLSRFKIVYGYTNTAEIYESLQIGGAISNTARYWKGNIPELIVFDTIINDTLLQQYYQYLRHKYSPPVNLLYDIRIPYGFCDTAITTAYKPWFTSYEWSTGATDSIIHVNKPGVYSVTVTDIFGFESSDDIRVFYPEVNDFADTIVCFGNSVVWDADIIGDYTYAWYGSSETTQQINIDSQGDYAIIVNDTLGCQYLSDTINFSFDNYEFTSSVGPADTTLCAGNRLMLVANADQTVTWEWSTGASNPEIVLSTTGEYSVTTTNWRGCQAVDTINVTINGTVPEPNFESLGHCSQNPVYFTDLSTSPEGTINSWTWSINGEVFSTEQNPSWVSGVEASEFEVKLVIETDAGCSDFITNNLTIYPLPTVSFTPQLVCQNTAVEFTSTSSVAGGTIINDIWAFLPQSKVTEESDDRRTSRSHRSTITNTDLPRDSKLPRDSIAWFPKPRYSSKSLITHTFTTPGYHTVQLTSTTDAGCVDSAEFEVYVKPAELPQFSAENTCLGEPVYFINQTPYNPVSLISEINWDFGDGESSDISSPQHIFEDAGLHDIGLTINYSNGCILGTTQEIEVYHKPEVDIISLSACEGSAFGLVPQASVESGNISTYNWQLGDPVFFESDQESPDLGISDAGNYPISLNVSSDLGCSTLVSDTLRVHVAPESDFTASPTWGAVPLWVDFTNTSLGAEAYTWSINNEQFSSDENPYFVFQDSGLFVVELTSYNEFGCHDISTLTIKSVIPVMDIILYSLRTVVEGDYLKTSVYIINNGTLPVEQLNLDLNLGSGKIYRETIENFEPSQVLDYTFTFKPYLASGELPELVCVEAVDPTYGIYTDINYENNTVCNTNVQNLLVFRPYPNPASNQIICEFITAKTEDITITLINGIGKIVHQQSYPNHTGYQKTLIDVSTFSQGVYYLQISTSTEKQSFKIEVNR